MNEENKKNNISLFIYAEQGALIGLILFIAYLLKESALYLTRLNFFLSAWSSAILVFLMLVSFGFYTFIIKSDFSFTVFKNAYVYSLSCITTLFAGKILFVLLLHGVLDTNYKGELATMQVQRLQEALRTVEQRQHFEIEDTSQKDYDLFLKQYTTKAILKSIPGSTVFYLFVSLLAAFFVLLIGKLKG